MTDKDFATELVRRLNALLATEADHPGVKELVGAMVNHRVPVSKALADGHPTIHCGRHETAGLLGLLNGICGVKPNGWGYVAGVFGDPHGQGTAAFAEFERGEGDFPFEEFCIL